MAKKKDRGWIKLYRQITGTYIWEANEPLPPECMDRSAVDGKP